MALRVPSFLLRIPMTGIAVGALAFLPLLLSACSSARLRGQITANCTDTDGGNNPQVKGRVSGIAINWNGLAGPPFQIEDRCEPANANVGLYVTRLTEFYCSPHGEVQSQSEPCLAGGNCINGACTAPSPPDRDGPTTRPPTSASSASVSSCILPSCAVPMPIPPGCISDPSYLPSSLTPCSCPRTPPYICPSSSASPQSGSLHSSGSSQSASVSSPSTSSASTGLMCVSDVCTRTGNISSSTMSGSSSRSSAGSHASSCPPGGIVEYVIPTFMNGHGITAGPDGNIWFTGGAAPMIGRVTVNGAMTTFPALSFNIPWGIAAGGDGNLWFTGRGDNSIGRITPGGAVTKFPIPTVPSTPYDIAAGEEFVMWFTEYEGNGIGSISMQGVVTEYPPLPAGAWVEGITTGPDGALWFAEMGRNVIGKITTAGTITEFAVPVTNPKDIVMGGDGNLWFMGATTIARMTTDGTVTQYPIGNGMESPSGMALGPDGAVWFVRTWPGLGRIAVDGTFTEYTIPANAYGVTAGPDGNIWFMEAGVNRIGKLVLGCALPLPRSTSSSQSSSAPPPSSASSTPITGMKSCCTPTTRQCQPRSPACAAGETEFATAALCTAQCGQSSSAGNSSSLAVSSVAVSSVPPPFSASLSVSSAAASSFGIPASSVGPPTSPMGISSSSAPPITGGSCTGNECQNGGTAYCQQQGQSCQTVNALPCMRCAGGRAPGGDTGGGETFATGPRGSRPAEPSICTGRECQEGGDAYCTSRGQRCETLPAVPCLRCSGGGLTAGNQAVAPQSTPPVSNAGPTVPGAEIPTPQVAPLLPLFVQRPDAFPLAVEAAREGVPPQAWTMVGAGVCGDTIVTPPEECDDGNTDDFDSCTTTCRFSARQSCTGHEQCPSGLCYRGLCAQCGVDSVCGQGRICISGSCRWCGDNRLEPPEICDDGNTLSGDGCSTRCQDERALVAGQGARQEQEQGRRHGTESRGDLAGNTVAEGPLRAAPPVLPALPGLSLPSPVGELPTLPAALTQGTTHAPVGDTGPAALAIMAAGAAAGVGWVRRRRRK